MLRGAVAVLLVQAALAQQPAAPAVWAMEPAARDAGYRLEMVREGLTPCAVVLPPAKPTSGSMVESVSAVPFRGKTVRLSAWLRVRSVTPVDSAQLWMSSNALRREAPAVNSPDWTRSEITVAIGDEAETISVGVRSAGSGSVWIKEIALLIVSSPGDKTALPTEPANLKFSVSDAGTIPAGWHVLSESTYQARTMTRGCRFGPPCAALRSAGEVPPEGYGALMQTFSAAKYRGRTVRFHATVRLQGRDRSDHARLWLRTGRGREKVSASNLFEHMDYREFRSADWTAGEIVTRIDDNVEDISIGVMLMGRGTILVDEVSFTLAPDPESRQASAPLPALSQTPQTVPPLANVLPETNWPTLSMPANEEQRNIVNGASALAVNYIRGLPNFLCNLLIDRSENRRDSGWQNRDVLNVQLGFSDRTERYKLTAVNGRPTSAPYRTVGGAISEGDFGSVMGEIFRPQSAQFHWDHWTTLRHHIAHVFRYEIGDAKSAYELQFGGLKGAPVSTVTAHHGYVYIEKNTNNILRIEQIADPPAGFPLRYAVNVIDYDWSDVGGRQYLLPLRAEITMGSALVRSFNTVRFVDYRKFGAETQITFEQQQP